MIKLYDIAPDDAYLELVVAESAEAVQSNYFRVNIYCVQPEGLVEVQLFPQRENNTLVIDDWNWLSFREGIVQARFPEPGRDGLYQLTPEGYLIYCKEQQTILHAGDKTICVPERNVAVYENGKLGIAFEAAYTFMSEVHYNIYRSLDGGITWSLIVEDFSKEVADIDYISISDESTVYCFWGISGVTWMPRIMVSKDAGITWTDVEIDGQALP